MVGEKVKFYDWCVLICEEMGKSKTIIRRRSGKIAVFRRGKDRKALRKLHDSV